VIVYHQLIFRVREVQFLVFFVYGLWVDPLGIESALVVFNEVNAFALDSQIKRHFLDLHVGDLAQFLLLFKVIEWSTQALRLFLYDNLLNYVDTGEDDLRLAVALASHNG